MINTEILTTDSKILLDFIKNNLVFERNIHDLKSFYKISNNIINHYYKITKANNVNAPCPSFH